MMKDALSAAGIDTDVARVRSLMAKFTDDRRAAGSITGTPGLLLALLRDYRALLHKMLGEGHAFVAASGQLGSADAQQPKTGGADHSFGAVKAISGVAALLDRERGASSVVPQGRRSTAPVREPSSAQRAATKRAMGDAVAVAATVLDTFRITGRQGSMTPVGDIYVASYGRVISHLRKRAFVSSREHNLIVLLKAEAEKQAHIPQGAKTRDVFDAMSVEALIATASEMSTLKIGETHA